MTKSVPPPSQRGNAKIFRHAADEKTGSASGFGEDVREHRRGRRLAVRAGDGEHAPIGQDLFADPLRTRYVAAALIEHAFDDGIAARHRVADHDQIDRAIQMFGFVALIERDAERGELVAHRRIDIGVAAGDVVAHFARERGQAAHEGAANSQNIQFHDRSVRLRGAVQSDSDNPLHGQPRCGDAESSSEGDRQRMAEDVRVDDEIPDRDRQA